MVSRIGEKDVTYVSVRHVAEGEIIKTFSSQINPWACSLREISLCPLDPPNRRNAPSTVRLRGKLLWSQEWFMYDRWVIDQSQDLLRSLTIGGDYNKEDCIIMWMVMRLVETKWRSSNWQGRHTWNIMVEIREGRAVDTFEYQFEYVKWVSPRFLGLIPKWLVFIGVYINESRLVIIFGVCKERLNVDKYDGD